MDHSRRNPSTLHIVRQVTGNMNFLGICIERFDLSQIDSPTLSSYEVEYLMV